MPNSCEDSWHPRHAGILFLTPTPALQLLHYPQGSEVQLSASATCNEKMYGTSRSHNHLQQAWWGIMGWKLKVTSNVRSVSWHKHSKVWFAGFYVNCKMPSTHGCNDRPISLRRYVGVHNGLSHLWSARSGCTTARHVWIWSNDLQRQTLRPLLEEESLESKKLSHLMCTGERAQLHGH